VSQGEIPGQDMAANVLVGLGLGYLLERFWPQIKPFGLAGGLVLGAVSGFYQLFMREEQRRKKKKDEAEKKP
jgi:F0F1-type ATP synthase assembly protein I